MKKLRLRKEIKEALLFIVAGLIIVAGLLMINDMTNKNVETCINNGVDKNICEELRK